MGMGLCVAFIAFVRLPSLKVSTLLLTGLLIYDVFWVFFSSYIFNTNVMVKVSFIILHPYLFTHITEYSRASFGGLTGTRAVLLPLCTATQTLIIQFGCVNVMCMILYCSAHIAPPLVLCSLLLFYFSSDNTHTGIKQLSYLFHLATSF